MKIYKIFRSNKSNQVRISENKQFRDLNVQERDQYLKQGASQFSKKFTVVIGKLANE